MDRVKVLIIDQNILVRRAVTNILQKYENFDVFWIGDESPDIEVFIRKKKPEVVLLSIDDMQSEGFTILNMIRLKFPDLPVIAVSPRSEQGAEAAINALRLGAVDFITKPEHKNLILFAERHLEKRLTPLINAAKKVHNRNEITTEFLEGLIHPQKTFEQINEKTNATTPPELIVIGGCTGGTQALFSLIPALPSSLRAPIVIVQHLPRMYTKYLASKLDAVSQVRVREVQDGVTLEAGDVWVAAGGYQCEVTQSGYKTVLNIHRGLRENNMRPSIDILFRTAAHVFKNRTLGILLSGCGYDGIAGAEVIRNEGGQVWVQDPRSAIAPELALTTIKKGLTTKYYSSEELAERITQHVNRKHDPQTVEDSEEGSTRNTFIF